MWWGYIDSWIKLHKKLNHFFGPFLTLQCFLFYPLFQFICRKTITMNPIAAPSEKMKVIHQFTTKYPNHTTKLSRWMGITFPLISQAMVFSTTLEGRRSMKRWIRTKLSYIRTEARPWKEQTCFHNHRIFVAGRQHFQHFSLMKSSEKKYPFKWRNRKLRKLSIKSPDFFSHLFSPFTILGTFWNTWPVPIILIHPLINKHNSLTLIISLVFILIKTWLV